MGAKVKRVNNPDGSLYGWSFRCPGCAADPNHTGIHVYNASWSFNGDVADPTFSPSLLHTWTTPDGPQRCHLFVRAGRIEYCGDCTHALAGQTIDLPEWDLHTAPAGEEE